MYSAPSKLNYQPICPDRDEPDSQQIDPSILHEEILVAISLVIFLERESAAGRIFRAEESCFES
jgi:hypothetical protein